MILRHPIEFVQRYLSDNGIPLTSIPAVLGALYLARRSSSNMRWCATIQSSAAVVAPLTGGDLYSRAETGPTASSVVLIVRLGRSVRAHVLAGPILRDLKEPPGVEPETEVSALLAGAVAFAVYRAAKVHPASGMVLRMRDAGPPEVRTHSAAILSAQFGLKLQPDFDHLALGFVTADGAAQYASVPYDDFAPKPTVTLRDLYRRLNHGSDCLGAACRVAESYASAGLVTWGDRFVVGQRIDANKVETEVYSWDQWRAAGVPNPDANAPIPSQSFRLFIAAFPGPSFHITDYRCPTTEAA